MEMHLLSIKIWISLFLLTSFPKVFSETPEWPPPYPTNCTRVVLEPIRPDLKDLNIEEILSKGVFYINGQISTKSTTNELAGTFIFGEVGNGMSFITQILVGDLDVLDIGLSKENLPVIFRTDIDYGTPDFQNSHIPLIPNYYEAQLEDSGVVAFWDTPGFGFNSGSNADFAQSYFLRHALEITTYAKFIFTINYSSFLVHDDLQNLATYITTMFKNVSNYYGSIGLVVTEVQDTSDLTDEEIQLSINNVVQLFIDTETKTAQEMEKNMEAPNEIDMVWQRIVLLEELLEKEEVEQTEGNGRLFFIRNPESCGSLSSFLKYWETVENLKGFHVNSLQYSFIAPEDFGLTLRAKTCLEIKQYLEETDFTMEEQSAVDTALEVTVRLNNSLNGNENSISIVELVNGFKNIFDQNFGPLIDRTRRFGPPISRSLNPLISDANFFLTCTSTKLRTIQLFQECVENASESALLSTWARSFETVYSWLQNLTIFYNFCNKTSNTLQKYSYQLILKDLRQQYGTNYVNKDTVIDFLEIAEFYTPNQIKSIWEVAEDKEKQFLVYIVQNQIPEIELKCNNQSTSNEKCQRGDFIGRRIFLSEVIDLYLTNYTFQCCKKDKRGRNEISVVALEKFYLDSHLIGAQQTDSVPNLLYLSIVSPVWEVIQPLLGYRKITLNGGKNDIYEDGGGFFGVYSEIINSERLFISANGAKGSLGLEGKPGTIYLVSVSNVSVSTAIFQGASSSSGSSKNTDLIYKPAHAISIYNEEFIKKWPLNCHPSKSEFFFWQLRMNEQIAHLFTPLVFANDLATVERRYSSWKVGIFKSACPNKMNNILLNFYEKNLPLIANKLRGANDEDRLALSLIGSSIISKMLSRKKLENTLNIISTETYLTALEVDVKVLENLETKFAITKETQEVKNSLDMKIQEARKLISHTVYPVFQNTAHALKKINVRLLATLNAFLKAENDNLDAALAMEQELIIARNYKLLWSGLNIVGTFLGFFGWKGKAAGAIFKGIASFGDAFTANVKDPQQLPGSFSEYLPDAYYLDDDENPSPRFIQNDINLKLRVDKPDKGNTDKDEDKDSDKDISEKIAIGTELIDQFASIIKEFRKDQAKLAELRKRIKGARDGVNKMQNHIALFHSRFVPMLDNLVKQLLAESLSLGGSSKVGLTVKKWEITKILKTMMKEVQNFAGWIQEAQKDLQRKGKKVIGDRGVFEKFQASFNTMEETLLVIVELYNHIEDYQDKMELTQFIGNVNSPNIDVSSNIENPELKAAIMQAVISVKSSVFVEKYKKALHAFRQFVFPFASYYLTGKNNTFDLELTTDFEQIVYSCKNKISNLRSALQEDKAVTTTADQYLFYYNFTSIAVSSKPFYVWSNEKWKDSISRLFQGQTILMHSDVNMVGHENAEFLMQKAAIKFKFIQILIKTRDKNLQKELNAILKNFRMHMVHSGLSLYKVNGQNFVMRDKKVTYSYNLENNIGHNAARDKVQNPNSDYLLSPYTWWTLSIEDLTHKGFGDLEAFAPEVDLELEGSGIYLDEKKAGSTILSELRLSEHYESYDPNLDTLLTYDAIQESSMRRCSQTELPNIKFAKIKADTIYEENQSQDESEVKKEENKEEVKEEK